MAGGPSKETCCCGGQLCRAADSCDTTHTESLSRGTPEHKRLEHSGGYALLTKRGELPSEIKTCAKMDMLNKLKDNFTSYASSAVTNTVYNTGNIISGVLPGNPVTR